MSVSKKAEYEMRRMEAQARFPYLIHISNEDYGDFYYANFSKSITFNNQTYSPSWFEFNPPERTESSIGNASITISALPDSYGNSWIEKIRGTQNRSTIEIVGAIVYNEDDEIEVEATENMTFTLTSVSWNDATITWQMIFDDDMNIKIPCDLCTSTVTPGCA